VQNYFFIRKKANEGKNELENHKKTSKAIGKTAFEVGLKICCNFYFKNE